MQIIPTPKSHQLPFRAANFATLTEALDYAAQGETGANFYTRRGQIYATLPYRELQIAAQSLARKMLGLGLQRGDRVALIAKTSPDFLRCFFASMYAGLVPVALPASFNLGSHKTYVRQLRGFLENQQASAAVSPGEYLEFLQEAGEGLGVRMIGAPENFDQLPEQDGELPTILPDDVAYIQYTSGSTRFPRGVVIEQRTVMSNLAGISRDGIKVDSGDRFFSWLPFYHDMGLVGLVLVPLATQTSVDYLDPHDFAIRPRQWLNLMSETKATISFSPSFGYELCARRLNAGEAIKYDLSHWRIAGIGAEMIRPPTLDRFAKALAPAGFDSRAFLACYGMAECSLAVSFAPIFSGYSTDSIDGKHLSSHSEALSITAATHPSRVRSFVNCGTALPDYEVEIRDDAGRVLSERCCGTIFLRGPSVTSGYFNAPAETRVALSADAWLNTGDVGYFVDDSIYITGRKKDLIIINGRNIWPQDLEYLAEQQAEVRIGDALAFSVPNPNGGESCVLVAQCREYDPEKRVDLIDRLTGTVRIELGIDCYVELVPLHTLPRTSSGKLSRSRARQNFIDSNDLDELFAVSMSLVKEAACV
ncbi:MAG: fatty acyl-AMP ligase [Pseudomonadales bacterium]